MHRKEYQQLIREEARHWDNFEEESLSRGIPWWVDLRKAKMRGSNLSWMDDPQKEQMVRGEEKRQLIELALRRRGKVLDLGCGSGWLSLELARSGVDVTGIDLSPVRINVAKKNLAENPHRQGFGNVEYKVCDLNGVELSKEKFDTVVSWDSLHHVLNIERLLSEVRKSLKPGGQLIVFDHIGNKFLQFAGRLLRKFSQKNSLMRIAPFEDITGKKMVALIREHFSIRFIKTRLSAPISILLYFFSNQDSLSSLIPLIVKVDKFLCNKRIFCGEYVFIHALKE